MLHCGHSWQPTVVKRVVETFETSTRVARVATDQGIGFLKGIGNPAGLDSLVTELVCGELARWFGLQTPDFAVIKLDVIEIFSKSGTFHVHGPAFISREVTGLVADGDRSLLVKLTNPSDIMKLVVFDTWVRNSDRCHTGSATLTRWERIPAAPRWV